VCVGVWGGSVQSLHLKCHYSILGGRYDIKIYLAYTECELDQADSEKDTMAVLLTL